MLHHREILSNNDEPLRGVIMVAAGQRHTCALVYPGQVVCWGDNALGQLGYVSGTVPYPRVEEAPIISNGEPSVLNNVVSIEAGAFHTCAIQQREGDYEVLCWGSNVHEQIGITFSTNEDVCEGVGSAESCQPRAAVVNVDLSQSVLDLMLGEYHTCVLTTGHEVRCWGNNYAYQLFLRNLTMAVDF